MPRQCSPQFLVGQCTCLFIHIAFLPIWAAPLKNLYLLRYLEQPRPGSAHAEGVTRWPIKTVSRNGLCYYLYSGSSKLNRLFPSRLYWLYFFDLFPATDWHLSRRHGKGWHYLAYFFGQCSREYLWVLLIPFMFQITSRTTNKSDYDANTNGSLAVRYFALPILLQCWRVGVLWKWLITGI
jgi:hypothetical protein